MHFNMIMYVLSHALGPMGRYSILSFRISTVFDINPLKFVRFQNSRYFENSRSFSCLALPFSLSFSYFKCKSRKQFRRKQFRSFFYHFRPFSSLLKYIMHSAIMFKSSRQSESVFVSSHLEPEQRKQHF
jgi:hypothetical protein